MSGIAYARSGVPGTVDNIPDTTPAKPLPWSRTA
jgi:hypothetical protein